MHRQARMTSLAQRTKSALCRGSGRTNEVVADSRADRPVNELHSCDGRRGKGMYQVGAGSLA